MTPFRAKVESKSENRLPHSGGRSIPSCGVDEAAGHPVLDNSPGPRVGPGRTALTGSPGTSLRGAARDGRAEACAHGETGSCALGAASMFLGGMGEGLNMGAKSLSEAAEEAPFLSRVGLKVAAFGARRLRDMSNGMSVLYGGLSMLPSRAFNDDSCAADSCLISDLY